MKNYTLLILLLLLLPFGCNYSFRNDAQLQDEVVAENKSAADFLECRNSQEDINNPLAKNLVRTLQDSLRDKCDDVLVLDFSKHKFSILDTIIGDFNGDGREESAHIFEYSPPGYDAYGVGATGVAFSDESIPFFMVRGPYFVQQIINEGDLTGDSSDEIGFNYLGAVSYWGLWVVFSFIDGEWTELVNFSHNPGFVDDMGQDSIGYEDLVMIDPDKKGHILIKELEMSDENCLQWITRSVKIE